MLVRLASVLHDGGRRIGIGSKRRLAACIVAGGPANVPVMEADDESWRTSRREAFEALAHAQRRAEAAEADRARPLVADFLRRASEQGLTAEPLRARAYSGSASYRTGLTGWYLQPTGPLAIGEDGEFYVLIAAPGLAARLRGVVVAPSPPPLAVGRGARDGESMSLQELLERRLAAGNTFRRL